MPNQKIMIPPFREWTEWEVYLFEEKIGVATDSLRDYMKSDRPKAKVRIGMLWIALRRRMPDISFQEAGEGPFEGDLTDWIAAVKEAEEAAPEDDDTAPLDQSPPPDDGDEHGTPS